MRTSIVGCVGMYRRLSPTIPILDALSSEVIQIVAKRPCLNGFVFIARLPNNKITRWVTWFSPLSRGDVTKSNVKFFDIGDLAWNFYSGF